MTIALKKPSHPGAFIRELVLEPLELSITDAAQVLGITRAALSNFINQKASLSSEMAIRLDKAFGVDMETLMLMQANYDIAQARRREGEIDIARFQGGPKEPLTA